jgi:hypothetical protein
MSMIFGVLLADSLASAAIPVEPFRSALTCACDERLDKAEVSLTARRSAGEVPGEGSSTRSPTNGKIYVGMDLTDMITYFGTVDSRVVTADFTREQCRDFAVRKEILFESETATDAEVRAVEVAMIRELRSNDPVIGYNR